MQADNKTTNAFFSMKRLLSLVGALYIVNGLVMWFAPHWWYETVPGIVEMGLYHKHLIRDVGIVYIVAGFGQCLIKRSPAIALYATMWPALHALYHIAIFFDRGLKLDAIAATNLLLIQIPAWASLWAAWRLRK